MGFSGFKNFKIPLLFINITQKVKGKSEGIITLPHKTTPERALLREISGRKIIKKANAATNITESKFNAFFTLSPMNYFIKYFIALLQRWVLFG